MRTQRCFFVESASNEIAIFSGGDTTLTVNTNTTRMSNYFANHMFSNLVFCSPSFLCWQHRIVSFLAAYWPFCYVIRPFVWMNTSRSITESRNFINRKFKIIKILIKPTLDLNHKQNQISYHQDRNRPLTTSSMSKWFSVELRRLLVLFDDII